MGLAAKVIWAAVGLVVPAGLLYYAQRGAGLNTSGKKLLRVLAVFIFVVIALVVMLEQTV